MSKHTMSIVDFARTLTLCGVIHDHGFNAIPTASGALRVWSDWYDATTGEAGTTEEIIPATWQAVRDWLGY